MSMVIKMILVALAAVFPKFKGFVAKFARLVRLAREW